jgi:hypothetical protein
MRPEERRKAIEVTLHSATIEQARAIGGTVSRGIEMSVTEYWAGIQPPTKAKRKPSNQTGGK